MRKTRVAYKYILKFINYNQTNRINTDKIQFTEQ